MIITNRTEGNRLFKKTYYLWWNITQRCLNPKNPYYKNYGAKGVSVCSDWLSFDGFVDDIDKIQGFDLDRFLNGELSLDKDESGKKLYSLKTCKFMSKEENNRIKPNQQKRFVAVSPDGKKTVWANQSEFSRQNSVSQSKVSSCIRNGKSCKGWKFYLLDESCNDYHVSE